MERFVTNGYKVYDTYKDDEYLVNEVEIEFIVKIMNNLDKKARERSKALSKAEKGMELLIQDNNKQRVINQHYWDVVHDWFRDHWNKLTEEQKDSAHLELGIDIDYEG